MLWSISLTDHICGAGHIRIEEDIKYDRVLGHYDSGEQSDRGQ